MPYSSVADLPDRVKKLPEKYQRIWLSVFNNAIKNNSEGVAFRIAWGAVKNVKMRKSIDAGFEQDIPIAKVDEMNQIIFGWANVSVTPDGEKIWDAHNDHIPIEELELGAYYFVLRVRVMGTDHDDDKEAKGYLVESVVFTKDKMKAIGIPEGLVNEGWWVGFYIPDKQLFADVLSGKYRMLSIQGISVRKEVSYEEKEQI